MRRLKRDPELDEAAPVLAVLATAGSAVLKFLSTPAGQVVLQSVVALVVAAIQKQIEDVLRKKNVDADIINVVKKTVDDSGSVVKNTVQKKLPQPKVEGTGFPMRDIGDRLEHLRRRFD